MVTSPDFLKVNVVIHQLHKGYYMCSIIMFFIFLLCLKCGILIYLLCFFFILFPTFSAIGMEVRRREEDGRLVAEFICLVEVDVV